MRSSGRVRLLAAALVALPMSQFGHLIAYWLRFGPEAIARQSSGAHAYFPAVVQTSAALAGGVLLGVLLLVGLGRMMVGLRNDRMREGGWPLLPLLALLLAFQLAIYAEQELAETSIRGLSAPGPGALLGWGLAGQLPVAALAALAVSWLSGRVRAGVRRIRRARPLVILPREARPRPAAWALAHAERAPSSVAVTGANRGPPLSPLS
jgi:hypothetical protein